MENIYNLFKNSTGVCIDTREIIKDSLFIAIKGSNFDGNDFVIKAIEKGAKFAITENKNLADNQNVFFVNDTLKELQNLANYHRKTLNIPVVGITGSNGKTTTKELINNVLKSQFKVLATKGNLNNHIGVPLTLLQIKKHHEIAIIEMGANKYGDIKELSEIAEPSHGIITNIGKAHLEGFINFEGVYKTKKELFDFIHKNNGTIFINNDYPELNEIKKISTNKITYGRNNSNINGKLLKLTPYVKFEWKNNTVFNKIDTQLIGEYNFYNLLCAVSVGLYFNIIPKNIQRALETYIPKNNRSEIVKTKKNTIILDAYNANPSSMKSAIESFDKMKSTYKLMILGDMFELGTESKIEHQKIIDLTTKLKIECLYIGSIFKSINKYAFVDKIHLINKLKETKDNLILIKGSRGMKLEELVKFL